MPTPINEIRGVTPELEAKLKEKGFSTGEKLLEASRTPGDRRSLASSLGVSPQVLLELVNRADLSRIRGVAGAFSDLLENAGVDTIKELAVRVPENVHAKLESVQAEKKIGRRAPSLDMVRDWIAQAKELPKLIEY